MLWTVGKGRVGFEGGGGKDLREEDWRWVSEGLGGMREGEMRVKEEWGKKGLGMRG